MSKELPNLSVLNDVIRVDMPDLRGAPRTFLGADVDAAATASTVLDNTLMEDNDWLVYREIGDSKAEITQLTAGPTRGTAIAHDALVFDHPLDTPVTEIFYNQVEIYGSTTATDASPTLIDSAKELDVAKGYTEFQPTVTYAYYYARFKNSETSGYSAYSTAVVSTGLARNSVGKIIERALQKTNSTIDPTSGLTQEFLIQSFNDWQDQVMSQKKKWSWLYTDNRDSPVKMTEGVAEYSLPTDIQDDNTNGSIVYVRLLDNRSLHYIDPIEYNRLMTGVAKTFVDTVIIDSDTSIVLDNTGDLEESGAIKIGSDTIDYTGNTESTGTLTGVTNIATGGHAVDAEVYQNTQEGEPTKYTIRSGKVIFWPICSSQEESELAIIGYYKNVTDATEIASTTLIPFYQSAQYYLMEMIEIKKGDPSQRAAQYRALWRQILDEGSNKESAAQKVQFNIQRGRRPHENRRRGASISFTSRL